MPLAAFPAAPTSLAGCCSARVTVSRADEQDVMEIALETDADNAAPFEASAAEVLKLRGKVQLVPVGSLPNDGKVIDDQRDYS